MTSFDGYAGVAALSGKGTFLIVTGVIAIVIFVFRWKYAPPWWLRSHRDNSRQHQQDAQQQQQQPHDPGQAASRRDRDRCREQYRGDP